MSAGRKTMRWSACAGSFMLSFRVPTQVDMGLLLHIPHLFRCSTQYSASVYRCRWHRAAAKAPLRMGKTRLAAGC